MPHLSNVLLHFENHRRARPDCKLVKVEVHAINPELSVRIIDRPELAGLIAGYSKRTVWDAQRRANCAAATKLSWERNPQRRQTCSDKMKTIWAERKAAREMVA
jgi:hypothetical protein